MPKFRYAKPASIKWYGYFPAAILRRKYSGGFRFHCRYGPCACRILAGWPLRNPVTVPRSSGHQSKNRPIFFTRSRSSLVLKPLTVFTITSMLSSIFHLDTTRWEKIEILSNILVAPTFNQLQWMSPGSSCCINLKHLQVPGRFVPMHFRSRERNDHIVDVSFPGTKVWTFRSRERNCLVTFVLMNCRLLQVTTVALLGMGSRPTR